MSRPIDPACYFEARSQFLAAAREVQARVFSYPILDHPEGPLTMDVAVVDGGRDRTIMTTSGLHGVEGHFGSAVQVELLRHMSSSSKPSHRHVLVHAVNPYGVACGRRVNEDNIDLNRNFLSSPEGYQGSPDGYAQLDRLLNPQTPPRSLDLFKIRAFREIVRHGLQSLKASIAGGQYEYPQGLFYGGHGPSRSMRIIEQHVDDWLADSTSITHFDLHTGLGRWGDHQLFFPDGTSPNSIKHWHGGLEATQVETAGRSRQTGYQTKGMFVHWLQQRYGVDRYTGMVLEFGTYPPLRVIAALRAENRAHHFCGPGDAPTVAAKADLLECFWPDDESWRTRTMDIALEVIHQAELNT